MTRVHLIYPHDQRISCPDAIGRHLADGLRSRYEVLLYDWDDPGIIQPGPDDVLLGHPHPFPRTIFRRSLRRTGWRRRLVLAPYNHGDPRQSAWLDGVVPDCDLFLALTGEHWFETAGTSAFAHWTPKLVHMDLAVDRADFPPIKNAFNPPGERRFLFIGHSRWTKNVGYLGEIATRLVGARVSWMGDGPAIPGVVGLGLQDFRDRRALDLVAEHDFLLSVGHADANPAAVLEAMAWGLIPACSIESAHADLPGIVKLPLDNAGSAVHVLEELQRTDEATLRVWQDENRRALDERFTWERFTDRVIAAIRSSASPDVLHRTTADRLRLEAMKVRSPYAWWKPTQMKGALRRAIRNR